MRCKACVRRKIGAALVFASGFAEMDEAGRADQDAMARIANEAKLALCGPNCIGLVNLTDRVALTFEPLSLPAQVARTRHRRRHPERRHVLDLAAGFAGKRAQALHRRLYRQ